MKHPTQSKYLLIVIVAMLGPILLIGYCFYNLVFNLLAREMVFPEAIMTNLVPVIEQVNNLLIIVLPPLVLIILWFALVISHRFAGPIERLESELDEILTGNFSHKIRVRKKDDLAGVVHRINTLVKLLKDKAS
jgi:signal transduction histidine kinase